MFCFVLFSVYPVTCPLGITSKPLILAHECICSKFYVCVFGVQVAKNCPYGLHFNAATKKCESPEVAGCGSSVPVTTPKPHPTTSKPPTECPAPGSSGHTVHIAHEKYCNLFYTCTEHGKVLQKCPIGLFFNPKIQVCDWPWNVKCKNKPEPTTQKPTTTTKKPFKCPHYKAKLPHESDCSLYYICKDGIAKLEKCRRKLYFNPYKHRCDRRENVECSYEDKSNGYSNENSYESSNQIE
jgi:hypothetical protein